MKKPFLLALVATLLWGVVFTSCRKEPEVLPQEYDEITQAKRPDDALRGLYLLNEGNMGSNKATLDFLDFTRGFYIRNIYAQNNPTVVKELGDTGNDLQLYNNRLYVVLNGSHKVEVVEAGTCRRIGQVDIPSPRYIAFDGNYAYVTSYVNPQASGTDVKGSVYKIDLASLSVVGNLLVGYSPEEAVVLNGKLYVANSGGTQGFSSGNFDRTVSVIDLTEFKEIGKAEVGINPTRIRKDPNNRLWVLSQGNYADVPATLYVLEASGNDGALKEVAKLDIPAAKYTFYKDNMLYYCSVWDAQAQAMKLSYGKININTLSGESTPLITDGSDAQIETAYEIAVHPTTGEFFITDAGNFTSGGKIFAYSAEGKLLYQAKTGDIPGHIAFMPR